MTNFRIITIPFNGKTELFDTEALNKFCFNKNIMNMEKEFFIYNGKPYWSIFIEYENKPEKENNKMPMTDNDKLLYEKLREWRKEKAEKAGVPVYIVNTNEQMLAIIKEKPNTLEALKSVKGFGKKKIENYGNEILKIIQNYTIEKK